MKRILCIDGGGAKGLIPAAVLADMELKLGKPLYEVFDLIVGTSVGAILSGIISSGKLNAAQTLWLMRDTVPKLFHRRMWPLLPKYSREPYVKVWKEKIGENYLLGDCLTKCMITAVSECDKSTHYFKSWEPKDGRLPLMTATLRSFAAPMYFGGLVDNAEKTVWLDGGTGGDNCPILEAVYEAIAQGWIDEGKRVHIVSLGCGRHDEAVSFERAKMWWGKNAREVRLYADISDGGLARYQSTRKSVSIVKRVAEALPELSVDRVDCTLSRDMDCMDGVRYADDYVRIGHEIASGIDYAPLI